MSLPGLLVVAALVGAQPGSELIKLFPKRAPIQLAPSLPWVRVGLSAEVLGQCKGDLSDVRVISGEAQQVPYRVFRAPEKAAERKAAKVLSAERSRTPIKQDADAPALTTERYRLELPALPAHAQTWKLLLSTNVSEFAQRVEVRSTSEAPLWAGSLFRLPGLGAEKLEIELPSLGDASELELRLEGEGDEYLSPRFSFEASMRSPAAPRMRIPAKEQPVFEGGSTVLLIERPPGVVPERLGLATSTAVFTRSVRVFDVSATGNERLLAQGKLFKIADKDRVERLELELPEARGEWLRVEIEDGDSGPLEGLSVELILDQPTLLFALSEAQAKAPLWLYFGGGRAKAPRYDLAALGVWDSSKGLASEPSTLGELETNPSYQPSTLLSAFQRAGAPVEVELFSHQRPVLLQGSNDGLSQLQLRSEDAALLRADFGDLRLVDGSGRQWPYLMRRKESLEESQAVVQKNEESATRYELRLPASPSWIVGVELHPETYYFSRRAELWAEDEAGEQAKLAVMQLVNNPSNQGEPAQLSFPFPTPRRVKALFLKIENGQEEPLSGLRARLSVQVPELFTVATPGAYRLLLGSGDQEPPRYDLQRAEELVLNVRPAPVELDALKKNPDHRPGLAFARAASPSRLLLWACLGLAVAVLGALALRMARSEGS